MATIDDCIERMAEQLRAQIPLLADERAEGELKEEDYVEQLAETARESPLFAEALRAEGLTPEMFVRKVIERCAGIQKSRVN